MARKITVSVPQKMTGMSRSQSGLALKQEQQLDGKKEEGLSEREQTD